MSHAEQEKQQALVLYDETDYSRTSIYLWRRKYIAGDAAALASEKKHLPRVKIITDTSDHDFEQEELISKIKELKMEKDILKETIKILRKISVSIGSN